MSVAIINYELGNLQSVQNAIDFIGGSSFFADSPQDIQEASHVILPGVGAFGDGMQILNERGWSDAIKEHAVHHTKPFLGICLGMQLLADTGTENGVNHGLGLIGGIVEKMNAHPNIHIPHVGWNTVSVVGQQKMYEHLEDDDYYFVHSYVFVPSDHGAINGTCSHGDDFVASVEVDNIWGTQFHPEKSQKSGLQILTNFLKMS